MSTQQRNTKQRDRDRATIRKAGAACHICGQAIDYSLPHTDPKSFVVDHVIPLVKGEPTPWRKRRLHTETATAPSELDSSRRSCVAAAHLHADLGVGVGVGIGLVSVLGTLANGVLPFLLSPLTALLPAAVMVVLGLAGAAVALRTVTKADPLTALGSNR